MHTSSHVSRRPFLERWRLAVVALAVTVCATIALAAGGPATATAAGPVQLEPGEHVQLPTPTRPWEWTTFCAHNHGSAEGTAYLQHDDPYGFSHRETISLPGHQTGCISGRWWGNPIDVTNLGLTTLTVWTEDVFPTGEAPRTP